MNIPSYYHFTYPFIMVSSRLEFLLPFISERPFFSKGFNHPSETSCTFASGRFRRLRALVCIRCAASCRCAAGRCQGPARRSPGARGQAPDHWPAAGPLRRAVDRPDHGATAAATREPLPKIEAHTQLTLLLKGFYMH